LKFDFVIISLKNKTWPYHATSGHQNRKLRGARGGKPLWEGHVFIQKNLVV